MIVKNVFDYGEEMYSSLANSKPEYYESFVDIYDFFDVLLKLFEEKKLLNTDPNKSDFDPSKINFIEEYPDDLYNDEVDTVVYSMGERKFQSEGSVGSPTPYIQRKPVKLKSQYDLISNNTKTDYAYIFDNVIELEVFSKSRKRVGEISRFIESFMLKYKGELKHYVSDIVYVGQSPTNYNARYFDRKLLSRSIVFRVITYSNYSLITEELKEISSL